MLGALERGLEATSDRDEGTDGREGAHGRSRKANGCIGNVEEGRQTEVELVGARSSGLEGEDGKDSVEARLHCLFVNDEFSRD